MKVDHNKIQLGSDPDPTKNFIIQTPPVQDGTLEIRRGTLDAPGALVATFNEHGLVDPRVMVTVTGSRSAGVTYTNNTPMPLVVYITATSTDADGGVETSIGGEPGNTTVVPSAPWTFAVSTTVPSGVTYAVNIVRATIVQWREYRLPEGA